MKKKRLLALLTSVSVCFSSLTASAPISAFGAEEATVDKYYLEEVLHNYQQYLEIKEDGYTWLLNDEGYAYVLLAQKIRDAGFIRHAGMRAAYKKMGEKLTEEDCVNYLSIIMQILDSGMEANIQAQADYDSSKNWKGYAVDAVSLAADAVGLDQTAEDLKYLQDLIGLSGETLKFLTSSKENMEAFVTATQGYEQHKAFLETVSRYADTPELVSAADQMLSVMQLEYAYALDIAAKEVAATGKWTVKTHEEFISSTLETWLLEKEKSSSGKFSKKLTGDMEKKVALAKKAVTLLKSFNLGAGIGALAGDIFIGNEYRYLKEVMVLDDMSQALKQGIDKHDPENEISKESQYKALKVQVPLLESLCAVRTRGEYCANMIAQANDTLFGVFIKDGHEKTAVYERAFALQQREYQLVSEIFIVDDFPVTLLWCRYDKTFKKANGETLSELYGLWPAVSYDGEKEAYKKITTTLKEDAIATVNSFLEDGYWTDPNSESLGFGGSSNIFSMSPVLNTRMDRSIISIVFNESSYYMGAAHPIHWLRHYNFDPETGELLTMADILESEDAYRQLGTMLRNQAPKDKGDIDYERLCENAGNSWGDTTAAENSVSWYFTDDGLCITYAPYEIAPYMYGFITWEFSYQQLKGIVKDQYLSVRKRSQKGREIEAEVVDKATSSALYYIFCNGGGNGKYQVSFSSPEIIYDVCIYDASDKNFEDYSYNNRPIVTISSLSPSTVILVKCGSENPSAADMLVRWTDGNGNQRETMYGVGTDGEITSDMIK